VALANIREARCSHGEHHSLVPFSQGAHRWASAYSKELGPSGFRGEYNPLAHGEHQPLVHFSQRFHRWASANIRAARGSATHRDHHLLVSVIHGTHRRASENI
jgi:hypothetical protein